MQKMMSYMRSAMERYNMIEDGDKIAVGVSAGKDSLVTVVVDKAPGYSATMELNITPPCERNTIPAVSDEKKEINF